MNSTGAADDLDALRAALGARTTLTLIGQGFGATLAAVYADRYPGRVGCGGARRPGRPARRARRPGGRDRGRRRAGAGHLRGQLRRLPGRLPAGRRPARRRSTRAVSTLDDGRGRPGIGGHQRRQRAADPAAAPGRPGRLAGSWPPPWLPRPTATASRSQDLLEDRWVWTADAGLAERRDHLRLQRQRAADLAAADVGGRRGRSGRRRRCSAPTRSDWSACAVPGRRRRPRSARSRPPARHRSWCSVRSTTRSRPTRQSGRWPGSSVPRRCSAGSPASTAATRPVPA